MYGHMNDILAELTDWFSCFFLIFDLAMTSSFCSLYWAYNG